MYTYAKCSEYVGAMLIKLHHAQLKNTRIGSTLKTVGKHLVLCNQTAQRISSNIVFKEGRNRALE